ncbi:hypothetical protein KIN20_020302 [Parelaphostrongylus tenuis]|uniref:Uncharacterized protein n=1 Tax=Parelaphostrongylus tenuis TaxID=148309 RepID=A0AAD5QTK3_PARTN|nr:hypothetical protein KIN20_020302 [Parelaphostrongylus tenuis]
MGVTEAGSLFPESTCVPEKRTICKDNRLHVKTQNSKFYPCYHEGQLIHVEKRVHGVGTVTTKIVCPPCAELCGRKFCAPDENINGRVGDPTREAIRPHLKTVIVMFFVVLTLDDFLALTLVFSIGANFTSFIDYETTEVGLYDAKFDLMSTKISGYCARNAKGDALLTVTTKKHDSRQKKMKFYFSTVSKTCPLL